MQADVVFMGAPWQGVAESLGFESISAGVHTLLDSRGEVNPGVSAECAGETIDSFKPEAMI